MGWGEAMPDGESYVRQMVEDMHQAVQSIDRMLRGHNGADGLLTELSHVKRTADDNGNALRSFKVEVRDELKKMRRSLDRMGGKEDPSVTKARLRLLAEIVVAVSAMAALAMQLLGG